MISIVMLTYNNVDKFKRCIQSMTPLILDKRVKELLLWDNGSHEIELLNFLKEVEHNFQKCKVFYSSENLGIAKGRKRLFDMSTGDYIFSFDSDIVVLNHELLIGIFMEAMQDENMWLIGGGGGNHPYFPSLFREDINNLVSAEKPNQLTFVEEVAGWCQCFRKTMLVKNGGKIYMDERFTPFWGEDSDFCLQIRLLGGKCAILGKGVIAHTWSSCDKKDTQKTIDDMWKKMTDKWYPQFGDTFKFDFDEEFYKKYYSDHIHYKLVIDDYLCSGIERGFIGNPRFISRLYPSLKYNDDNIIYENKSYHVRKFIDKFMTTEKIIDKHLRIVHDNLETSEFTVFLLSNNDSKSFDILKKLKILNGNISLVFCYPKDNKHIRSLDFINDNYKNFITAEFIDYYDFTIPFTVLARHLKDKKLNTVVRLNSDYQGQFVEKKLSELKNSSYEGNLKKVDRFTLNGVFEVFRYRENQEYFEDGCFMLDWEKISNIVNSFPISKTLEKCLRIPTKYSLHLTPKHSPRFVLERLYGCMKDLKFSQKTLIVVAATLENEEDVKSLYKNNSYFKRENCEIMVLNDGNLKHVKPTELNTDYYYLIANGNLNDRFKSAFGLANLQDYNNVIFSDNSFQIETKIDKFIEQAYYRNLSFLKEGGDFKKNLFSLQAQDVGIYYKVIEEVNKAKDANKELNIENTINANLQRLLGMTSLWESKKKEDDDEIIIEYYKKDDKYEDLEDFPLFINEESS